MFYGFKQNNSGGSFDFDGMKGISVFVIVEADNVDEANDLAEGIGLYFDGCSSGIDCTCCGDRWYPTYEGAASEYPSMYGGPDLSKGPYESHFIWMHNGKPEGFIHYKNGIILPVAGKQIHVQSSIRSVGKKQKAPTKKQLTEGTSNEVAS